MKKYLSALVVGTVGVTALAGSAIAGQEETDAKNKFPKGSDVRECDGAMSVAGQSVDEPGGDTIVFEGASVLWPPNHKYRTVSITADGDTAGEGTTLKTTVASSQPDNALGDGNTTADATPTEANASDTDGDGDATTSHQLRGERQGTEILGRAYTIVAEAKFDNGSDPCTETFTVTVPHDMGAGNDE